MTTATPTPRLADDAQRGSHSLQRLVGRHGLTATLYNADCLDVMPLACDAVVTDPPYGTTACKWDDTLDLPALWERLKASVKTRGAVVMTASQPFTAALVMSNLDWFKYCWVWEKSKASNFLWADYMPLKAHEDVVVFSDGQVAYAANGQRMAYYAQKERGEPFSKGTRKALRPEVYSGGYRPTEILNESGDRNPRSVIYFRTAESEGNLHPTQKPVALMAYLVATYAQPGETVLDPYMGSGTTGIAALRKGCNFIGIERDAAHYKTACDRIAHELDGALL